MNRSSLPFGRAAIYALLFAFAARLSDAPLCHGYDLAERYRRNPPGQPIGIARVTNPTRLDKGVGVRVYWRECEGLAPFSLTVLG